MQGVQLILELAGGSVRLSIDSTWLLKMTEERYTWCISLPIERRVLPTSICSQFKPLADVNLYSWVCMNFSIMSISISVYPIYLNLIALFYIRMLGVELVIEWPIMTVGFDFGFELLQIIDIAWLLLI